MDVRHALRAQPIIVGIFFVDSATRQIVGGGRIIEADTMEGFISRALGEARDEGEGSSITPSPGPKKRYLPSLPARMRRVGKEARSARMPGPISPRRPPVAWKNSIHRQPGNRACPSAFLSSPLFSSPLLSSPPFLELVFVSVLKILHLELGVFERRIFDEEDRGRVILVQRGERVKPRSRRNRGRSRRREKGNFTRLGSRFGFSWDRVALHTLERYVFPFSTWN